MDGDTRYSIGELARRTGLTVKTVRFYSERGIVPPTDRSPAGHRRYDTAAVERLRLVRTLRELGLDLATIREVVDRGLPLPEVAAVQAEALAVQIRVLRLRHAVLTVVAERGLTPEETDPVHRLARLTEDQRRDLVDDFLHAVFDGAATDPVSAGAMRSMTPELSEDPDAEQARAWVELAELALDPDFRAAVRRTAEELAADRARVRTTGPRRDLVAVVRDLVAPALAAGVRPASPQADPVVAALTAHYAQLCGRPDDTGLRRRLLLRLESANDPRRDRYLHLLAVINRWPAPEGPAPALTWSAEALRARTG
ncbi:MerR family transcriptional regulator [Kitasatospora phosalacinea]|uniref:MerR family transcriptional regulator n=1 Tax=Kitasatospora phosalacinea TaxID=2065 RepID=A0A9W6PES7_9ACTN|nr:MerR family transcriptional regulator [Kitasatospora phosalacinea]GLW53567.1 MerR family transcriptional regulator [Kitasatospora phosalacinea]